jgi:phosphopantothenoylcysteine decarboxylase/phosphopantothenate--cysteine ligase
VHMREHCCPIKPSTLQKRYLRMAMKFEIVLSSAATKFISPLTLKALFPGKVHLNNDELDANDSMIHITLAKKADAILIAPASANIISKLSSGAADCLISLLCLATDASIIIAPAMNKIMWGNKFVQKNIEMLKASGASICGPAIGLQACGDFGEGRLIDTNALITAVDDLFTNRILEGKNVIITAGATKEMIDPVRFISNNSSGKMGYAIAKVAKTMGAKVTLISANTSIPEPPADKSIKVESTLQLLDIAMHEAPSADFFISVAAVADYRPEQASKQKIKTSSETLELKFVKNPDIIASIKSKFPNLVCVGFAAETENLMEFGLKKLLAKGLDFIAINDVSNNQVFAQNTNKLTVVDNKGEVFIIPESDKENVARQLLAIVANKVPSLTKRSAIKNEKKAG